jgi:hypothetical protein
VELSQSPRAGAYAAVECAVRDGDTVKAESGCMVTMSDNVHLEAKMDGGLGLACLRSCCAGEGLFLSHCTLKPGMVGCERISCGEAPSHTHHGVFAQFVARNCVRNFLIIRICTRVLCNQHARWPLTIYQVGKYRTTGYTFLTP